MKTQYLWSDVLEYLEENLDKEFVFGNPQSWRDERCCLISSFFTEKTNKFGSASYFGNKFHPMDENGRFINDFYRISDFFDHIQEIKTIHLKNQNHNEAITGREILENWKNYS